MFKLKDSVGIQVSSRYFNRARPICRGKPPDHERDQSIHQSVEFKLTDRKNYKGEIIMKPAIPKSSLFQRVAVASLTLLAVLLLAAPKSAYAVVASANSTIHNPVTVKFTAGSQTLYNTAIVNVTVATLAALPTIYKPTALSVYPGGAVSYTGASAYEIRSNSNGPDTYTFTALTNTVVSGVTASSVDSITASVNLWGGYIMGVGVAASNQIKIPAGSELGLTIGGLTPSTIEILIGANIRRYSVTAIAVTGTVRTTPVSGVPGAVAAVTTAEAYTTLTLAPIGHAITADTAAVGTQAGEYKTFDVTFTAGTSTSPGTDGYYDTTFTITTTAKKADNLTFEVYTGPGTPLRTTVTAPSLTITKKSRNVTKAEAVFAAGTTQARPGDVIEYEITVTNSHTTADATNISISDALPADYVTELAGVYTGVTDVKVVTVYNGAAAATTYYTFTGADTDQAFLSAGILKVTLGNGAGDANNAAANGGTLKKTPDNAIVYFQATVK